MAKNEDLVQVNVRVSEEQKFDWEEYVEESAEFTTLSGLIRGAVAREVVGGGHGGQVAGSELNSIQNQLRALEDAVDDVSRSVAGTESMIERVKEAVEEDRSMDEIVPLIFDRIPVVPQTMPRDRAKNPREAAIQHLQDVDEEGCGSVEWISSKTGIGPGKVRSALEKLQQDTGQIRTLELNGVRRYYKNE